MTPSVKEALKPPSPLPERLPAGTRFCADGSTPMVWLREAALRCGAYYNGECREEGGTLEFDESEVLAQCVDWPSYFALIEHAAATPSVKEALEALRRTEAEVERLKADFKQLAHLGNLARSRTTEEQDELSALLKKAGQR